MSSIEKTSLEAHVELCSERYQRLEDKLDEVVRRIERSYVRFDKMEQSINIIKEFATNHHTDRFKSIDDKQIALDTRISNLMKLILSGSIVIVAALVTGIFTLLP
jgi:NADH:ubiquinone oxidoreductase subunit D|tara:strand:- start:211 stop:525 length:315 start_codon:yes stop_codon:yes gene_type:complete